MTVSKKDQRGPLTGVRVLDLSRFIAGPYCAMLLGDLGADVVKVESRGKGENSRSFFPQYEGESLYTAALNRNKRSITLNFRSTSGQVLLRDLIAKADVVIENFVPGTLEKMNCGWTEMHEKHPQLIMTRISGFKSDGPYGQRPCFDVIAQAMSGLMDLTGDPDGPPTAAGVFVVDYTTALYATIGTLGAVQHQVRTGEGQLVEATLMSSAMSMMLTAIPDQMLSGHTAKRMGTRDRFNAPGNTFRTRDGCWILLIAVGDEKFRSLAQCMNIPNLAQDERFSTNDARMRNVEAIEAIVREWVAEYSHETLLTRLEAVGIPCAKVATVAEVVKDPNVIASNLILEVPGRSGEIPVAGFPFDMSGTPPSLIRGIPAMGEHNAEVLGEWLGVSRSIVSELETEQTI